MDPLAPEAWPRISPILDAVLEADPEERHAVLADLCDGDDELRSTVERLLRSSDVETRSLDRPAAEVAARLLSDRHGEATAHSPAGRAPTPTPDPPEPGDVVAGYRIEGLIGRGGMGEVYLGFHPTLEREVALKLLPAGPSPSDEASRRLIDEARAASALDHPNIQTVFDAGKTEDGRVYVAFAYYDGASLRARLDAAGRLSIDEAVEVAAQLAGGLSAAHRRGIVHRDIKPSNVILTPEGRVKILDFGVARVAGHARKQEETTYGTIAYMSPEQTRDGMVDARTDIWSLGVMLYEMLTGRRPFDVPGEQSTLDRIYRIRTQEARPLRELRPEVPEALAAVVERCLAKRPDDRPANAGALERDLRAAADIRSPVEAVDAPARSRRRRLAGKGVAAAATVGLLLASGPPPPSASSAGALGDHPRVVLADFESRTADSSLALAITEAFGVSLARSRAFDVLDRDLVAGTLRRMERPQVTWLDAELAREVAAREGHFAALSGTVDRFGPAYLLSASLLEATSGKEFAAVRARAADSTELLDAVDRLADRLGRRIDSLSVTGDSLSLARVTTGSLEALRKYSRALQIRNSDRDRASELLREAVALDTAFAMAWRWLSTTGGQPRDIARAYAHRGRATESERYLIEATYHQFQTRDLRRAVIAYRNHLDLKPESWVALWNLGLIYGRLGESARAEQTFRRSIEAHPLRSPSPYRALAAEQVAAGRFDQARRTLEAIPDEFLGSRQEGLFRLATARQDYAAARAALEPLLERWPDGDWTNEHLAYLEAVQGRISSADERLRARIEAHAAGPVQPVEWTHRVGLPMRAMLKAVVGADTAGALGLLEGAVEEGLPEPTRGRSPRLSLARTFALAGAPERASGLLTEFTRAVGADGSAHGMVGVRRNAVLGHIAFAEGRYREAVRLLRGSWLEGGCRICNLPLMGRSLELAGEPDAALALYERYVSTPDMNLLQTDALYLARVLERLGDLHAERGDTDRAQHFYRRFVELWGDADPELQPRVLAARERISELRGRSRDSRAGS